MNQKKETYYPAYLSEKAQYLAREQNDCTIRYALCYSGHIHSDLLFQATKELIGRIDILHASFQAANYSAKWVVNTDYDVKDAFHHYHVPNEDIQETVDKALLHTIQFEGKLQMHVSLVSNEKESAIVLSVGHMCADGKDALYLFEKLIELYNCLLEGKDTQSVVLKNGTRSPEQCCKDLTLKNRIDLYSKPSSNHKTEYVYADKTGGNPRVLYHTISSDVMTKVRMKGKEYRASVNDLLLAAFYRATAWRLGIAEGQGMGIQSMMDLRRRMPNGDSLGVCNLSGSLPTELENGVYGDFAETLQEIVEQTTKVKNDPLAGLYDFPMMSGIFRIFSFSMIQKLGGKVYGTATMGMTNLGALQADKYVVGGLKPQKAIFAAPLKQKPAFQLAIIGLNGDVCISSAGTCTEKDVQAIRELLERVQFELEEFCK